MHLRSVRWLPCASWKNIPGLRVLHDGQPVFKAQPVREPPKGEAGAPKVSEFPSAVKGGGVVINVTMDVLLVDMCGNDKRVPPLCPAHSRYGSPPSG